MKRLKLKPYIDASPTWPEQGRVVMAHYDAETVVVYQAYRPSIAQYAAEHQQLGGPGFSFERMSWIKPGFLWTMYRSGWATEKDQEAILAIWLKRSAFDEMLEQAVPSLFDEKQHASREAWQAAVDESEVRVQWDPEPDPRGMKLKRKAIQLGLRGDTLRRFAGEWIVQIEDISGFVRQQSAYTHETDMLFVPDQKVYKLPDRDVAKRLGVDQG
jgi:hypothetical protein